MLDENERKFVKSILQHHLEDFQTTGRSIITDDTPTFLAAEEQYEEFLKKVIQKL